MMNLIVWQQENLNLVIVTVIEVNVIFICAGIKKMKKKEIKITEKVETLPWKKAIIVYIGLPEVEE